ncbi:MAG: hypothetical protein AAB535_02140 [Patescibacteria group bacterium]
MNTGVQVGVLPRKLVGTFVLTPEMWRFVEAFPKDTGGALLVPGAVAMKLRVEAIARETRLPVVVERILRGTTIPPKCAREPQAVPGPGQTVNVKAGKVFRVTLRQSVLNTVVLGLVRLVLAAQTMRII